MELTTYLAILWRRKWVIAVTLIVTVTVVVIGTFTMTPTYTAAATLRVAAAAGGTLDYTSYMYAERLMNTYAQIATSGPVLEEAGCLPATGRRQSQLNRRGCESSTAGRQLHLLPPNGDSVWLVCRGTHSTLSSRFEGFVVTTWSFPPLNKRLKSPLQPSNQS